ncbi:flagellar biosynthetic protein FliO [Cohnella caldifontis]|uniref:flagellar biosynthetic protein FliO n=1 Tax=Cohnella caldifontis TaxID=3027471 RepID=UPI0023ED7B06|nr:flagellar biosynthetic protein FliO [Cohnella sp. YIM B05605]
MNALPIAEDFGDVSPGGSAWEMLWILFVLAVIVGLIVLTLRFLGKRSRGWGMNRSLRSLGGYPLGTNKSMQIVEWNGRIYVLGVGENVTLLEAISDPDLVAALLAEHDASVESDRPALPSWLRKLGQRRPPQADKPELAGTIARPSFEQTLEARLRELAERRQRAEQLLEDKPPDDRSDHT